MSILGREAGRSMSKGLMRGIFFSLLICMAHQTPAQGDLMELLAESPNIAGRKEYAKSPYVTAGDRVYMVGAQDGSFPELGWHIKGEMGGIWNHPIKLMDGFDAALIVDDELLELKGRGTFVNFPFANVHEFDLKDSGLLVKRIQFVPDGVQGIVIQYSLRNTTRESRNLIFRFNGHADLRPTWLGEKTGMIDGTDTGRFETESGAWIVADSLNPWFVVFGSSLQPIAWDEVENPYSGQGVSNRLEYDLSLRPGEQYEITIRIAGSYKSEVEALSEYAKMRSDYMALAREKSDRYRELKNRTKLTIPDKKMEQTFEWLKYNCDWLVRRVPEIGTGIMAGIPDYPWWFGVDSEYALKGYMAIGQYDVAYETISLLDGISEATNGNGRIVHEVSTNGHVFNKGNINETPQFASLIWEVYRWNGDKDFIRRYFPTVVKGLAWLLDEKDTDGNLFPEGFGMMEIHGLDSEMIDVAAYTQRAFLDASRIAGELGLDERAREYSDLAARMKEKINDSFWSAEFGSYADFIGTDQQALRLIDDAITRADTLNKPWAVEELKTTRRAIESNPSPDPKPFVLHHNWVVNTPMEMNIADDAKARIGLATAERFVNPFGVFVTGIDRDESAGSDEGSFKGSKIFSYTGAVMTLPTGVQVVAENNYGRPDKALNYLERMTRTFSYALPGSMYEVSPDYGMMTQAWNVYSFAVPIVQQFFGIQPDAAHKVIRICPGMPQKWTQASLENVRVGDNMISVHYDSNGDEVQLRVEQSNPDWKLILIPPGPEGDKKQLISTGSSAELRFTRTR